MINKELALYIQAQLAAGTPEVIIKEILMARGGWRANDVDEAIRSVQNPLPQTAAPAPAPIQQPMVSQVQPQPQKPLSPVQPVAPTPSPVTPVQQQPTMAPKPAPSAIRQPGTTLISQSPEIVAPRPVAAPVLTPTPAPIAPQAAASIAATAAASISQPEQSQAMPNPFAPRPTETPVMPPSSSVTPPMPVTQPTPVPVEAPKTFEMPPIIEPVMVTGIKPTMTTPSAISPLPSSMAINDIQPPTTSSLYQPTHSDETPHFVGMQSNQPIVTTRSTGKKIALIIFAVLLVVILGGAAAYGYFFYLNPSPKTAFNYILPRISSAQTGHFKATAVAAFDKSIIGSLSAAVAPGAGTGGVPISEDTSAQATLVVDGTFDRTNAANAKSDATITVTTTAAPLTISFQTKYIDSVLYAKVPDLGFLTDLLGGNSGAFLPGDWVSFAKSDAETAEDLSGISIATSGLTPEAQGKFTKALFSTNVLIPTIELSKETYAGKSVHRYQFSVDQQALVKALQDSFGNSAFEANPDSFSPNELLSGLTVTDGELWVGVWDRKPYRITFTLKPQSTDFVKDIKVDITLDALNEPVTITAPVSAKPFTVLFQDARNKAQDSAIKAMLTSVPPAAEIYYSSKRTYLGLCTDPKGLKDLFDAMSSQVLAQSPYCAATARGYAVAASLATQSGVSCIDAKGAIVSLAALPTGAECK